MITKFVSYGLLIIASLLLLMFGANITVNMIDFIYHHTEPMTKEYQPSPTLSVETPSRHQANDPAQSDPTRHLTNAGVAQSHQQQLSGEPKGVTLFVSWELIGLFASLVGGLLILARKDEKPKRHE